MNRRFGSPRSPHPWSACRRRPTAAPSVSSSSSSRELDRRGHEVTTFASGDSEVPGRLVATVPEALRPAGYSGDAGALLLPDIREVLDRAARVRPHPQPSRVGVVPARPRLADPGRRRRSTAGSTCPGPTRRSRARRRGLVAISENQASAHPEVRLGGDRPQRPDPRRRAVRAAPRRRARASSAGSRRRRGSSRRSRSRRLSRPAAADRRQGPARRPPSGTTTTPSSCRRSRRPGSSVEFLGELDQADRDQLFAESYASLMPGSWPEPFGLVAIEALACGTPVIARRVGGLPEIIRDGVDGFFGDDATAAGFPGRRASRSSTGRRSGTPSSIASRPAG